MFINFENVSKSVEFAAETGCDQLSNLLSDYWNALNSGEDDSSQNLQFANNQLAESLRHSGVAEASVVAAVKQAQQYLTRGL